MMEEGTRKLSPRGGGGINLELQGWGEEQLVYWPADTAKVNIVCMWAQVCVCVCVRERESVSERGKKDEESLG